MTDADGQMVQLLTELRDAQREELAYRRKALEESLALARRGIRMQRTGLMVAGAAILVGAIVIPAVWWLAQ